MIFSSSYKGFLNKINTFLTGDQCTMRSEITQEQNKNKKRQKSSKNTQKAPIQLQINLKERKKGKFSVIFSCQSLCQVNLLLFLNRFIIKKKKQAAAPPWSEQTFPPKFKECNCWRTPSRPFFCPLFYPPSPRWLVAACRVPSSDKPPPALTFPPQTLQESFKQTLKRRNSETEF